MKRMEDRTYKTMKIKFYPSFIPKAKGFFNNRKRYFDYLKKLVQENGISFLVGIAVGVNLILLLQMSEDTINKLSETLTISILGIAGIISTVIVGVTIFYVQKKTDRKITTIIEQQHTIVEDENKPNKEKNLDLKDEVNNEL
jgi:uncharacterized membrane protein YgaE (UPF0421/DUF939 family)